MSELETFLQRADTLAQSGTVHPEHAALGTHLLKAYQDLSPDARWALIREVVDGELMPYPDLPGPLSDAPMKERIFEHVMGVLFTEWHKRTSIPA